MIAADTNTGNRELATLMPFRVCCECYKTVLLQRCAACTLVMKVATSDFVNTLQIVFTGLAITQTPQSLFVMCFLIKGG